MAKASSRFVCQECGRATPRWLGRCPDCGAWDSFAEEATPSSSVARGRAPAVAAVVVPLPQVEEEQAARFSSGVAAVDRVLGGGVVRGGTVLVAGEPGIGKSTLLLAAAEAVARGGDVALYASAEESPRQLRLRAERLGCASERLLVAGETALEAIVAAARETRPTLLVVDSIQAMASGQLSGLPGSIGQVRACADALVRFAKESGTALFLVGHVTKEGGIAGPKSLEHLVDTVLSFEGDRTLDHRLLRAVKNRFGATGEVALFRMHDGGLEEVPDPSRALLALRRPEAPGSAVHASLQGSRPLLVEIQALLQDSALPSPRRMAIGLDPGRVSLLCAVLQRYCGLRLAERDLFLNVVGGLALKEPAADLAVAAAILSADRSRALVRDAAFFGEIGLLGEVRPVSRVEARLREVAALGLRCAVLPAGDPHPAAAGVERQVVRHVSDLVEQLAPPGKRVRGEAPGR